MRLQSPLQSPLSYTRFLEGVTWLLLGMREAFSNIFWDHGAMVFLDWSGVVFDAKVVSSSCFAVSCIGLNEPLICGFVGWCSTLVFYGYIHVCGSSSR